MRSLLVLVAVLATSCVLFGAPPCYLDAKGREICPTAQSSPSFVWSTPAPEKVAAGCDCAPCNCGTAATASVALSERSRAVLFPRARGFVSSVVENRPRRIANFFARGILMRFRR